MRIIAGFLGGREFQSPPGHRTHPMSDKVRGALFNVLGDIEGLTLLDVFAGSGALGFEAISRGAKYVLSIEIDKTTHSNILKNIKALDIKDSEIKAVRAGAASWSANNSGAKFDLVICDPPYDKLQISLLQKLSRHLKPKGLFVLS